MFKEFLKKYSFVLCTSLSSTACFAMELEIEPYTRSSKTHQVDKYMDFEVLRHRLEEDKENAPKMLFEILDETEESLMYYDKKFMSLYAQTAEELSEKDNWIIQLYRDTLSSLGTRYCKILFSQAIFYYIVGAKAKCPHAYENLRSHINGERPQYILVFAPLLNFLREGDVHAQQLLNRVLDESKNAYEWLDKYIESLEKNEKKQYEGFTLEQTRKTSEYEILSQAKKNYKNDKGLRLWNKARDQWDGSPADAINSLLEAELINVDARNKLHTLRQSKRYKESKKAQTNDHTYLLKNIDLAKAPKLYASYVDFKTKTIQKKTQLSSNDSPNDILNLIYAAEYGNQGAKEEVRRIKKSRGYKEAPSKNLPLLSEYNYWVGHNYYHLESLLNDHYWDNSSSTQENEVKKSTNHNGSQVNSSPVPSSQEKKGLHKTQDVSSQEEIISTASGPLQKIEVENGAIFVLGEAGCFFVPDSFGEKKLNEKEEKADKVIIPLQDDNKTSLKVPVEKQKSTHRTMSRTVSEKTQKPEENAEKPYKEINLPQTNTNSTPIQKMEEKKEDLKSPERSGVETTKHNKHRAHREKVDTPNEGHIASTSREESQDFAPTPTKKHKQLQRADSVRALPIERPTLKRTNSLGQMPVVTEPTTDTNKKRKTLTLKRGVELLSLKKKSTQAVEKKDSSSSQSKKSSSYSKSGASQSEEKLSKSEGSHSKSKKKGSSEKPVVKHTLFFANDQVKKDCKKFASEYENVTPLLEAIKNDPFGKKDSLGKTELLKYGIYAGCWSRRINLEHRIVYSLELDDRIKIWEVGEHYQRS